MSTTPLAEPLSPKPRAPGQLRLPELPWPKARLAWARVNAWLLSDFGRCWLLLAVLTWGVCLRLDAAAVWNGHRPNDASRLVGDEPNYDNLARELLAGWGFTWPGRVPLYPLWLAGVYWLTGGSYAAVPYVQIVLGVAVIALTFALGRRLFGFWAGLLAAALAANSYILIQQGLHLLSEALYTPALLMVALSLDQAVQEPRPARLAWAGFWVGVANLVRPMLFLFPLAAGVLFVAALGPRRAWRAALVYAAAAMLVVAPWLVRNYQRYGAWFALQTSNAILWQGSPEYYHLVRDEGYTYMRIWDEVLYGEGWRERDPNSVAGERYWTARALSSIRAEPAVYLRFAAEKAVTYWIGDPGADWNDTYPFNFQALREIGFTQKDAVLVSIARALPLAAGLCLLGLRRHWRRLLPVLAALGYATLLHAATHAEARLSEPLQPLLLVLLAGAAASAIQAALRSRRRPAPARQSVEAPP